MKHRDGKFDRRAFLKITTVGGAAAMSLAIPHKGMAEDAAKSLEFRTLGRTEMKVAIVGIGALKITEPAIFQAAFERGVNYVDTARGYLNGNSEKVVGQALKGYRDKVYVATKFKLGTKEHMLGQFEESLRCLETDYVDVIQVHNLKSKGEAMDPVAKEVITQLKKEGKVRYAGVTTHSNEVEVAQALIDDPDNFYDVLLIKYNFQSPPEIKQVIQKAAEKNIGIVAMKTQNGGYQGKEWADVSPHQAALKWVLQDKNVALAVPGMNDLAEVMEDTAVMRAPLLTSEEKRLLERYGAYLEARSCRLCGECNSTCPNGVDIQEVNRCLMYAEGYRDIHLAKQTFREIPAAFSVERCTSCQRCSAKCVRGLDIAARMRRAQELFA